MANYKQGWYTPKNPDKYVVSKMSITEGNGIRYMSGYEYRFFQFLDLNPGVLQWSSEPFGIPYFSEIDQKMHNYYPDVLMKVKDSNGNIVTYLVEIKPFKETIPPAKPKKKTAKAMANFQKAMSTYIINKAKWESAEVFCKNNDLIFKIVTEKEIF